MPIDVPLKAAGGGLGATPWWERSAARNLQVHSGPINSPVAGRTDHIPMHVASGSYVIPADIVSGIGQGNTASGHQVINTMFRSGPYGNGMSSVKTAKAPMAHLGSPARPMHFADGGAVPIMAAGGEHVLSPDQVALVGGGDIVNGHEALDAWVEFERKKINKEQKELPGPATD